MAKSAPLRIELDSDLDRRLSEVAEVMDQPETALVEQAVRDFLEVRDWQDAAIDEGLRAAEEGRVFEHDEIVEWVASWDTERTAYAHARLTHARRLDRAG